MKTTSFQLPPRFLPLITSLMHIAVVVIVSFLSTFFIKWPAGQVCGTRWLMGRIPLVFLSSAVPSSCACLRESTGLFKAKRQKGDMLMVRFSSQPRGWQIVPPSGRFLQSWTGTWSFPLRPLWPRGSSELDLLPPRGTRT